MSKTHTQNTQVVLSLAAQNNADVAVVEQSTVEFMKPKTVELIERYRSFARKTAEAFIELANTYAEAKHSLDCVEFNIFSREIGVNPESATSKRLLKIATEQGRFMPHINRLPNAYTTLYQLARLDTPRFEALANSGRLNPFITAKDIEEFRNESSPGSKLNSTPSKNAYIGFDALEANSKTVLWNKLSQLGKDFGIIISIDRRLSDEISDLKMKEAA